MQSSGQIVERVCGATCRFTPSPRSLDDWDILYWSFLSLSAGTTTQENCRALRPKYMSWVSATSNSLVNQVLKLQRMMWRTRTKTAVHGDARRNGLQNKRKHSFKIHLKEMWRRRRRRRPSCPFLMCKRSDATIGIGGYYWIRKCWTKTLTDMMKIGHNWCVTVLE
jgi:hypothetical protein